MPTSSLDSAALEKLHETFVEAFRANDLKALGECYTEEAVLLPPGRAIVSGRSAIVAFWQNAERIQDLIFEATDVKPVGDNALREAGNLVVTLRGKGRETRNTAAKYVALWLKADGAWKLDSTIWNGAGWTGEGGGGAGRGGRPGRGGGRGQGRGLGGGGGGGGMGQGGGRAGEGGRRGGPGQGGGRGRQGADQGD